VGDSLIVVARGSMAVAALAGMVAACFGAGSYSCNDHVQCDRQEGGVCEASGYCSYPEGECPSGQAYDDLAPGELHEACVPPDASTSSADGSTDTSGDASTTGCIANDCEDRDGDGYGVGPDCELVDCDDDNPAQIDGCRYIAPPPLGDDAQPGTREQPWATFAFAIGELAAGDSLVLLDGEYTQATTGLPLVDCSAGAAPNGIGPDMPLSMRAENERAAYLRADPGTHALRVVGCSWWNFTGLAGRGDDGEGVSSVASIASSQNIRARRLLFSHANRWANSTVYSISESSDVVLEESEAYFFHRHGIQLYQSSDVTIRRCYVNARDHADLPDASLEEGTPYPTSPSDTGDKGLSVNGEGHRVENCIVQGRVGVAVSLGGPGPSSVVGTIALDPITGVSAAADGGNTSAGHSVRDVVVLRPQSHGILMRSATDIQLEGITVVGGELGGLVADELGTEPCSVLRGGCGFTARHVLALGNADSGVYGEAPLAWLVSHSNAHGNGTDFGGTDEPIDDGEGSIRHSLIAPADEIGLALDQCAVFVPPESSMSGRGENGADIGANVLHRWVDGAPTDEPLWDPETGAFPCGAIVAGVNDQPGASCVSVHAELNVNNNGCALPSLAPPAPCESSASPRQSE
jgi:hypothetical protein